MAQALMILRVLYETLRFCEICMDSLAAEYEGAVGSSKDGMTRNDTIVSTGVIVHERGDVNAVTLSLAPEFWDTVPWQTGAEAVYLMKDLTGL